MIVSDEHYRAIREGAAIGRPMPRGRIGVAGKDRATYLHGLLTNDILALQPGTGCYAAWLTPQGRMTTDMHVLESGDMILLDVPAAVAATVLQRLDQFLFTEDVQLADLSDALRGVQLHGPLAAATVARTLPGASDLAGWPDYRNARLEFSGGSVVVARIDQLGVPGFTFYVDAAQEDALIAALQNEGAGVADDAALQAARVEAGYPLFGVDMDDDIIPLEAGIEPRAISLTKGCYVGQEVIIRVLHRGHGRVVRKLTGLHLADEALPAPGARLHAGGRDVGFVTSSAVSPRFGPIALGYVHRDYLEPGSELRVGGEDGPPARVSALPFA